MSSRNPQRKEECLLWKLESILDLYKNFKDNANEEDKLTILNALEDIREILNKSYITKPLRRKEIVEIETVLKDLNSHVKAIALDDLFDEVNELKLRMDVVEKRWEIEKSEKFLKSNVDKEDDDEIWSRISAKRKEILGKSSLWLKCRPPRSVYKVRFDLGSGFPVRVGAVEDNEIENLEDTCQDYAHKDFLQYSNDQLLCNRINSLQGFLKERKTRIQAARRRRKTSSQLVITSADATVQNNRKSLLRARHARYGEITLNKGGTSNNAIRKVKTPDGDFGARCGECHRLMKERNRFWGLESDSEDDEIKNFHEHVIRRSLRRDSTAGYPKELARVPSSSHRFKRFASRHKPRRIAGRGTWATPAYVPSWQMSGDYGRKSSSVHSVPTAFDLEKARFGPRTGILTRLFNRITGNHWSY